jgi:hypothetical protein
MSRLLPRLPTEHTVLNKPSPDKSPARRPFLKGPRPLADLLQKTLTENFARQGFAATELVTRWADIAGAEIAAHAEPLKIQWPRPIGDAPAEPATLILRVEGPAALEIQHQSDVLLERVNRFFGWQAVGRIALRQAPLRRRQPQPPRPAPDPAETARIAATLPAIADDDLRQALARLGAAVKRK